MSDTSLGLIPLVSIVVIGKNEGQRLLTCLKSIQAISTDKFTTEIIYVDTNSSDGSPDAALSFGAKVIRINPSRPSAAIARNAGWRDSSGKYVLFLDGDTLLDPTFIERALSQFSNAAVAIVWGHRREVDPLQSIYVRVLDLDWIYPPGETEFCGGDALILRKVLEQVDGFDEQLIAGEEPEMCRRIRAKNYIIKHIDAPMTLHDLAVKSFRAYWRRAFRAGYAYAEVSARFRNTSDPLWLRDSRRNFIHGGVLLLLPCIVVLTLFLLNAPLSYLLAFFETLPVLLLVARTAKRCAWKSNNTLTCWLYAVHSHFQQIPILFGQIAWRWNELIGVRQKLIQYKDT